MIITLSTVQLKWVSQPNDTEISVGQSLLIPCIGDGNPKPKVVWKKIDSNEHDDDDHNKNSNQQENNYDSIAMEQTELRFPSVSIKDSGTYECRITNGLEEDLVTRIKLLVRGK